MNRPATFSPRTTSPRKPATTSSIQPNRTMARRRFGASQMPSATSTREISGTTQARVDTAWITGMIWPAIPSWPPTSARVRFRLAGTMSAAWGTNFSQGRRGRGPQVGELQDRRVTALLGHRIVERSDRGGEDAVEQRAACDRCSPGGDGRLDCDQVRLGIERGHGDGLADLGLDGLVLADLVHQPGEVLAVDDSGVQPPEYPGHEQADRAEREQHLRPGVAAHLAHDVLPEGCVRAPLWPASVSSAATSFC